jgi:hypothetical protein
VVQSFHVNHAAPADQPQSVPSIAEILFPAYTVEGGRASLAGCSQEDRPLVRLRFRHAERSLEIYLDAEGREVDGEPVAGEEVPLTPLAGPPVAGPPDFERLLATGMRLAEERLSPGDTAELVDATAIWCKYVEGKLRFTIGSASVDLPFSGWTRKLAAPPWICPATGASTYHLAMTDDGRIAAAQRIQRCSETGRRMLVSEMVACSVTGRRVAPELTETCPVSNRRVLRTIMVECGMCRQRVSPAVVERNLCQACRKLRRVHKADPRMARLLHEHPNLDRWRHWRLAETSRVYVLVASGWLKRLLVVLDKDSLEFKLVATGSRLFSGWNIAEPSQYPYILLE